MKINPVHSSNPSDPDGYHECANCDRLQAIPARNKQPGMNNYRRCHRCTELINDGRC